MMAGEQYQQNVERWKADGWTVTDLARGERAQSLTGAR